MSAVMASMGVGWKRSSVADPRWWWVSECVGVIECVLWCLLCVVMETETVFVGSAGSNLRW